MESKKFKTGASGADEANQSLLSDSYETDPDSSCSARRECTRCRSLRLFQIVPWLLLLLLSLGSVIFTIQSAKSCKQKWYWRQSEFGELSAIQLNDWCLTIGSNRQV